MFLAYILYLFTLDRMRGKYGAQQRYFVMFAEALELKVPDLWLLYNSSLFLSPFYLALSLPEPNGVEQKSISYVTSPDEVCVMFVLK